MARRAKQKIRGSLLAMALCAPGSAAWGYDLGYGGRLTSKDGAPLAGPLNMVFHFYRSETNPTPTVSMASASVPLVDGVFQVSLALSPAQLDSVLGDGTEKVYIQAEANGRRYPKQLFMYVPLALRVPVDNDTLVFDDGKLKVGEIGTSQVHGLTTALSLKADVTAIVAGLGSKANSSHTHTAADVTNLTSLLSAKANINEALAGDVTGTLTAATVSSIRGASVTIPDPSTDRDKFLQYNGTNFVYTAIQSSSGGTVTNVSANPPLSVTNGTTLPLLSLSQASLFTDGYLSAADFSTLNSKQNAITAASTLNAGTVTSALQNGLELKPYSTGTGELRFDELLGNGTHYVGFKAPDALTGNKIWTLPTSDGAPGQVLQTDGLGNLSWTAGLSPADTAVTNAPSTIVMRDGSGNFTAGTITAALNGNVTGNVTGTAANVTGTVSVANGGTGLTSGTAGGIPYFSTSSSLSSSAALGDGQLLIGAASGAPVPTSLTQGPTAGVTIASGAGSLALDTAQDIRPSASPTFAGLGLGNGRLAAGAVATPLVVAGSQDGSSMATGGFVRAADGTGENVTGPDLTLAAGNGTGTGGSGSIQFLTAAGGDAGSAAGTMTPRMTIDRDGTILFPGRIFAGTSGSAQYPITATTDASGNRGLQIQTQDMVFGSTGSNLQIGLGAGTGDTYSMIRAYKSGKNAPAALALQDVGGNVGIGTTSPSERLDVAGIIRSSTGGFMFPDGSTMTSALPTPSSGYSSTTDLNMSADFGGNGTGILAMSTRGTERLRITNAGNIGIGSSTPGTKMDVVSGAAASGMRVLSGSTSNWTGYALGRTSTEATLGIAAGTNSLATGATAGDVVLRTEATSQRLLFGNGSGSPTLTIGNGGIAVNGGIAIGSYAAADVPPPNGLIVSGTVGVGTNTPSQPLEVAGIIKSSAGGFMFPDGSIMTSAATQGTSGTSSTSDLNLVADSSLAGTGDVILSANGSERMRIKNGGNIGIGTASPGDRLTIRSTKDSTVTPQLPGLAVLDSSLANSGVGGGIALWGNYTGTTPISGATIHAMKNNATAGDTGFNLSFNTRANSGNLTEKMRITSTGNVGIGTVAPTANLMVSGVGGTVPIGTFSDGTTSMNIHVGYKTRTAMSGWVTLDPNGGTSTTGIGIWDALHIEGTTTTTGNVGIGTTVPTRALDVNGVVRSSGGFMFPDGTIMTTAATSSSSSATTSSATTLTLAADAGASGTGVIAMTTAGMERMRVANDGNVGIGTTTPTGTLDVVAASASMLPLGITKPAEPYALTPSAGAMFAPAGTILSLNTTGSPSAPGGALIYFTSRISTGGATAAYIGTAGGPTGNGPAHIVMGRRTGIQTWAESLRLDSTGNLGIGTTAPTNLLDLSRGTSGSTAEQLILRNAGTTTSANTGAGLAFALTNASSARHAAINAVVSNTATGATDLTLSTSTSGASATEKVRIQAGGFVGIGTTSPANRLSVAGGADFTGNVGIGSAIPARALDVVGVMRASAGIEFPDGTTMTTAAAAGTGTSSTTDLSFAADSDANGSGVMTFATKGSERMRVDNLGNIGFGTATPLSKVAINGSLAVGTYASNSAPTNSMIISGNIGIGTTLPGYKLDVATSGAGLQTLERMRNIVTAANNSGAQTMFAANRTTSGLTDIAAVGGIITDITATAYKGALILSTANNSAPAERMRIDASGNVGIGTTAPDNILSVNGTANITGNVGIGAASPTQALEVAGNIKLSSTGSLIFPDGTSMSTAAAASTGSASATDLAFSADSDADGTGVITLATTGAERMRIDSTGNIGIGTTAPTARLTLQTTSSLDGINLVSNATSSSPAYSLYDGATERGVFGYAAAAGQRSSSASAGDIVLRATTGNLLLQTGTAGATMVLSNGNVGIGTTAPAALLDVSGNKFAAPTLTGAYIGLAGPTLTDSATTSFTTATNMAFNAIASPTLAASNASVTTTNAYTTYIGGAPKKGTNNTVTNAVALGIGAAAVTGQTNSYGLLVNAQTGATNNYAAVFQGGNVGIGSATPINRLDVAGTIRSSSGGFVFPDGSVMTTAITPATGGTASTTDLNLAADTESTGNGAVIVSTGTIERMRVLNSGNIGIATSTPVNTLSVNGTANFTGNVGIGTTSPQASLDVNGIMVIPSFETAGASQISFRRGYTTNVGIRTKAISSANYDGLELLGYNGFDFTVNNGADVAMRILGLSSGSNKGFVGIGTTAPSAALDVQSGTWSAGQLRIGATNQAGRIQFRRGSDGGISGSVGWNGATEAGDFNFSNTSGGGYFTWATSSTPSEKMRLTNAGNLGIGLTAPAYKLDVVGDINTTTCVRISGTQQLGTCASDARFKKNIHPITGALAKLRLLRPVQYEFRTEEFPSRHFSHAVEVGLIAQDLERVFPHLVVTDEDGYKRVTYGLDLEMQTMAAVKELALENDQLKTETAALRARADQAEAAVTHLKAQAADLKAESAALRAFLCEQFPEAPLCAR